MVLCMSPPPESPLYLSFPKNRARSCSLSNKTVEGMWDLPSEPEMDGKGRMEWFLSLHKARWRWHYFSELWDSARCFHTPFLKIQRTASSRCYEIWDMPTDAEYEFYTSSHSSFPAQWKWKNEWKKGGKGGRKAHWTINASTVLISSIPYQCQTVLDVCPELSAAKQGSCTFYDLAFMRPKLHRGSTTSPHW